MALTPTQQKILNHLQQQPNKTHHPKTLAKHTPKNTQNPNNAISHHIQQIRKHTNHNITNTPKRGYTLWTTNTPKPDKSK
jgi:DNA-binding response OmpR family regulator